MAYEQLLEQAGLSKDESKVYEALLKNGIMPAGSIPAKVEMKRGLVYKILSSLEKQGLIEKIDSPGKVALFSAAHPGKLREKLQKKEEEVKTAEASLAGIMGTLISDYNLFKGKPNVRFYEGAAGVDTILNDSLTAQEVIYSYVDDNLIDQFFKEENEKYVTKRYKKGITKKIIFTDRPETRERLLKEPSPFTIPKIMPKPTETLHSLIQIYDGKVSYLTIFSDKEAVGVIIEDVHSYKLHRFIFENHWAFLKDFDAGSKTA